MRSYLILFFAAVIIQSCSNPQKPAALTGTTRSISQELTSLDTTSRIFEGLYTLGNEINTFQDCGSREKVYWVNDSLMSLRGYYEKVNRSLSYPYESVYAEVRGYLAGKYTLGYASEYENVLVVTGIDRVEAKNFRTDCYNYEFIALGNEPFWSLDIIPEEQGIVLKDAGQEKAIEFGYAPANIGGGVHRYEATNPAKDKLVVVIREESCSDGMSDRQYKYSAEVTLNGRIYKGCAIKKGDQFADRP